MNNNLNEDIWDIDTRNQIINDIEEYLYLYMFKDASINKKDVVMTLLNLDESDLNRLKIVYFLLSKQLTDLIIILPQLLRNLTHTTSRKEEITKSVITGHINWSQTVKIRTDTYVKDRSVFVCEKTEKEYDLPENQLLKFLLIKIRKMIQSLDFINLENNLNKTSTDNWQNSIEKIYQTIKKTLNNIHIQEVNIIRNVNNKMLRKTLQNHNNLYEYVYKLYELYEKIFIFEDSKEFKKLLQKQILEPLNNDKLYEIYILFNLLNSLDKDKINLGLYFTNNDYTIHYDSNPKINIYYQHLPKPFKDNNYNKYKIYDLELKNRIPDIIIEYIDKKETKYRLVEIKRSDDKNYIRNSIYKMFAYLKDYEQASFNYPNILLVWDVDIKENYTYENTLSNEIAILGFKKFIEHKKDILKLN